MNAFEEDLDATAQLGWGPDRLDKPWGCRWAR